MNDDYIDLFKDSLSKCEKCNSTKLLLFVETKIPDCVAWACYDCKTFEIRAKPEKLDEYFENEQRKAK